MPKISGLPPMATAHEDDELAIDDASVVDPDSPNKTKRVSLNTVKTWLQSLAGWITTAMIGNGQVTGEKLDPASIEIINFVPGSNIDMANSSLTDWISVGDIEVPSWATRAIISISVLGTLVTSAANVTYRIKIASTVGSITARAAGSNTAGNQYLSTSWNDDIVVAPGTRAVVLQGANSAGTLRAGTASCVSISVRFLA